MILDKALKMIVWTETRLQKVSESREEVGIHEHSIVVVFGKSDIKREVESQRAAGVKDNIFLG